MIIYAKVVYSTGILDMDMARRDNAGMLFQKEFCLREYEHLRDERARRNSDDFIVCDSIDVNRYDKDDHLELIARNGKVSRHFNFTKVAYTEIDEEVEKKE